MVPAVSPRISRVLGYSGVHSASVGFRLRGCHPLWLRFPSHSANFRACLCYGSFYPAAAVTAPVWALPRSLATTCGIIVIFSSYGYLDVSVPHVRPRVRVCRGRASTGCPIRTSPDLGVFATPRSFSQLITSFFAFESLGILHMPFFAFFYLFALRVSTLMSCLLVLFRLLPIRQ